jgi:hypothetical protein
MEQPTRVPGGTTKQRVPKHVRPLLKERMPDNPQSRVVKPDPDPTTATKEFVGNAVEAAVAPLAQRLASSDKAVELLALKHEKEPQASQVSEEVAHLKELTLELVSGIKTLIEKTGELNNTALQAAFAAAKEAVGAAQLASATANTKMETNFTKQLDATSLLIATMEKSLISKIEDVKTQSATSIPRIEVTSANAAISDRLSTVEKMMASQQGSLLMASFFASAIPTIVAVLLFFLHK